MNSFACHFGLSVLRHVITESLLYNTGDVVCDANFRIKHFFKSSNKNVLVEKSSAAVTVGSIPTKLLYLIN